MSAGAQQAPDGPIAAGTSAPEFTLRREDSTEFTRTDLEGTTTVLVFFPFAFSPVCTDQLNLYQEVLDDFAARGATLGAGYLKQLDEFRPLFLGHNIPVSAEHEAGDLRPCCPTTRLP